MVRSAPARRVYMIGLRTYRVLDEAAAVLGKRAAREPRGEEWDSMHHAATQVAAIASTHLADMRDKARVILALQEATGLLDACSAYHAIARSLAQDVLAKKSS